MDQITIIELLFYLLPAVITGLVAYYFFSAHTKNEEGRRRFLLHKETQKSAIPLQLQAYERMALFLERINPSKLVLRIHPENMDKQNYELELIRAIDGEFEHNLSQQIYITEECWNVIKTSKNATIQFIRKSSQETENTHDFRQDILNRLMEKQAPSATALGYIKKEVRILLG
ncbi:hypothetical protein [Galbibacter sp.]|uniref:DUF7935 family protein n=1 Tax=Galbibacter sp. TaxID=2918471 RepID=UPI002CA112A5|nr:hypothetical protein [Galbibacter sp.]HLV63216.1 hypothetical protein [Galbibacter sp.]